MLEILLGGKAAQSNYTPEDLKTDTTALIAANAGKGSKSAVAVSIGGGGGLAIYNNQLITIVGTAIKYYDINNGFALAKSVTASVNANVTYNNCAHQSGSHYWIGQDRSNSISQIYHVDLVNAIITAYPTSPVKKGTFYAYKGKLWLVGGWNADNTANNTLIYSIDIANPTAWVSQSLRSAIPQQLSGASAYITDKGKVVFVGGGVITAVGTNDGGTYTTLMFLDPDAFTWSTITIDQAIAGAYHNPAFVYGISAYFFKYTNQCSRFPLAGGVTSNYTPVPTISGYHNMYTQAGRLVFYTNSYSTSPIYLYVLPE
jgi:hypothetical protein